MALPVLPPSSEADYEVIAAAVMETARGRWFLAEFARRNRHADTEMLLASLHRLENVVAGHAAVPSDAMRAALVDMARGIERAKSQITAGRSENGRGEGYEFDSIVQAAEQATSDVLAAAEQVQDIAWTLREQSADPSHSEFLEARATDIYSACTAQDLATQRMRRAMQTLRFLEGRVDAMLAMYGRPAPAERAGEKQHEPPEARDSNEPDQFTPLAASVAASPELPEIRPPADDPLAPLHALTREEKIALFS